MAFRDHLQLGLSSPCDQKPPWVSGDVRPHPPRCSVLQLANASGLFSLFSNLFFSLHPALPEVQWEERWARPSTIPARKAATSNPATCPASPSLALRAQAEHSRAMSIPPSPGHPGGAQGRAGQDRGAARGRYRTGAALLLGRWLVYCVSKMGGKCLVQGRLVQE